MDKVHYSSRLISVFLIFIIVVCISKLNCQQPIFPFVQRSPPSFLEGFRRYLHRFGINAPPNFGIGSRPEKQPFCFRPKCKLGTTMIPRPGHIPRPNGCGSFGFDGITTALVPAARCFTFCCNQHDLCYADCESDKVDCDVDFQACMYGRCGLPDPYEALDLRSERDLPPGPYDNCLSHADMIASGPQLGGCLPFQEAQKKACTCIPIEL